jgi:hypothetical protein
VKEKFMRKLVVLGAAALALAASVVQASAIPTLDQIVNQTKNVPANTGGFEGYRAQTPDRDWTDLRTQPPAFNLNPNTRYFGR